MKKIILVNIDYICGKRFEMFCFVNGSDYFGNEKSLSIYTILSICNYVISAEVIVYGTSVKFK